MPTTINPEQHPAVARAQAAMHHHALTCDCRYWGCGCPAMTRLIQEYYAAGDAVSPQPKRRARRRGR